MPRLHIVPDWDDTPDGDPTKEGDFATPGHIAEDRPIHRIVCPHHALPWGKIIAVQMLIAAAVALVACGWR